MLTTRLTIAAVVLAMAGTFSATESGEATVTGRASPDTSAEVVFALEPMSSGQAPVLTSADVGQASFADLRPGRYRMTATSPDPSADVTDVTCAPAPAMIGGDARSAVLDVQPGADVACRARVTERGRITVSATMDPPDADRATTVITSWGHTAAVGDDGSIDSGPLKPGRYAVQAIRPPGWAVSSAACDDGSDATAIGLAPGEAIHCTVSLTKLGRIVVVNRPKPSDARRVFSYDSSWQETVQVAGTGRARSKLLEPGTYTLAARVPKGWDAVQPTCDDGSSPDSIVLDAGETVRCVFQPTKRGRIVLATGTDPAVLDGAGTLETSWGRPIPVTDGAVTRSRALSPGQYAITPALPRGWVVTAAGCDDGSRLDDVRLRAGETVSCTVDASRAGRIVVEAATGPAGSGEVFRFHPSWRGPLELRGDQSHESRLLPPGQYAVGHEAPAGWISTPVCDDGSDPSAIDLDPGETVRCRYAYSRPQFTVATFNVLGHSHTERGGHSPGMAAGPTRMGWTVQLMRDLGVDLIGMQEVQKPQMAAFARLAGGEYSVYPGSALDQRNKQNALAWRTSEFDFVEGRPVMIPYFDGNKVPMPLVRLRHRATGQEFVVMTVHNPASIRRLGNQERWRDAATRQQIALSRDLLATGVPLIMTGDMNDRQAYFCAFTAGGDMHAAAGGSNDGRCQPPPPQLARIDWIFGSRDVAFSDYRLVEDGLVPQTSDHPFVVTDVMLNG